MYFPPFCPYWADVGLFARIMSIGFMIVNIKGVGTAGAIRALATAMLKPRLRNVSFAPVIKFITWLHTVLLQESSAEEPNMHQNCGQPHREAPYLPYPRNVDFLSTPLSKMQLKCHFQTSFPMCRGYTLSVPTGGATGKVGGR